MKFHKFVFRSWLLKCFLISTKGADDPKELCKYSNDHQAKAEWTPRFASNPNPRSNKQGWLTQFNLFSRFIYTGEVFVPQHDLQDFLRTAELLEIKGLLKDDAAWPPQGLASLFQAPVSPGPPQKQQQQQQHTVVLRYGSDKTFLKYKSRKSSINLGT